MIHFTATGFFGSVVFIIGNLAVLPQRGNIFVDKQRGIIFGAP